MHGSKRTCKACFYLNRLMLTDVYVWVLCLHYSPLLAVLAHAYSSAVARGRVAARTLTHLKANTAGGAAGRPGSPGRPRSISMVTDEVMSVCDFSHWLRSCAIGLACTRLSCLYCLRRRSWLRSHSSSHVAQRTARPFSGLTQRNTPPFTITFTSMVNLATREE